MSQVTDAFRKTYSGYADVSDDDLTAAIGQAYPGYRDEQKFPDFSQRFSELDEDYNFDGGWLGGMANAVRRGSLRAEMAGLVFDETTYGLKAQTPESAKRIAELNEKLGKVRGSGALQYYSSPEAQDDFTGRIGSMFASFPEFLAESLTSQMVVSAKIMPKLFGTSVVTGTAMGALSPDPITTAAGAGFGAMFGMAYGNGITSLAQEYTGTMMEVLSEHGVDTTNAEQLETAFTSPDWKDRLSEAKTAAYSRGVPIAALDALSFGIAGKLGGIGKEMLLQSAMGGTGELAGQMTSLAVTGKQRGNVEDVIIEMGVGAFADVLTDVVPATLAKTGKLGKSEKIELEKLFEDISERQAQIDEAESIEEDAILEQAELAFDAVDPMDEAAEALSEKVVAVEPQEARVKTTLTPVVADTEDGSFNSEADAAFGVQVGNTVDSVPYARFKSVVLTDDKRITATVTADGSLVVNPDELRANAEDSDLSQDEYLKRVVQEEAIHAAHLEWLKAEYIKETGDTKLQNFEPYFVQRMEAVAGEMTPEQVELVQGVYGSDIDGARLGLEYVRMLTQQRREGSVTEGLGIWEFYGTQPNPETRNYFKRAINWVRKRVQPKTRKKDATLAAEASQQLEGLGSLLTDIEAKKETATTEPEAEFEADVSFVSGLTSAPNELEAVGLQAGKPIGITAIPDLDKQKSTPSGTVIGQVTNHVNRGKRLFIDSGAFGAFQRRTQDQKKKGKVIRKADPNFRLDFDQLFGNIDKVVDGVDESQRKNVSIVMPDIIGEQQESIDAQMKHAEKIQSYIDAGFDVIIPIQSGELSSVEMYNQLKEKFGDNFRVGIPSNKNATPIQDIVKLVTEIEPSRVHMLGVGPGTGKEAGAAIRKASPNTHITNDASTVARVGKVPVQSEQQIQSGEFREAVRDERIDETEEAGSFWIDDQEFDESTAQQLADDIQSELRWFSDDQKQAFVDELLDGNSINDSFKNLHDKKILDDDDYEVTTEAFSDPRFSDIQNKYLHEPVGREMLEKRGTTAEKERKTERKDERQKKAVKDVGGLEAQEELEKRAVKLDEFEKQTDAGNDTVVKYLEELAKRITGNSANGRQAAQDIWSHLWEKAGKWLENPKNDNLTGFGATTIAKRKLIDIGRKSTRRGKTFLDETRTTDEETGESAVTTGKDKTTLTPTGREAVKLLEDFFGSLSPDERNVSALFTDSTDATASTVADALGINRNAVDQRKHRLLKKMKKHMTDKGHDPSVVSELLQAAKKRKLSGEIVREARAKDLKGQELKDFIKKKLEALPEKQKQQVLSELGIAKANKPTPSKTADKAAAASNSKTKRLKFTMSLEKTLADERTKKKLEEPRSFYDPITNKETLAKANARIDEIGLDAAKREVMEAEAPDAVISAMGIVLFQKFQAAGRLNDAIDIAMHVADIAKTQGQAIQVLSIVSRLSPDGASLLAARIIKRAKAKPETKDATEKHIKSLGGDKKIIERVHKKAKRLERLREDGKLNDITELSESAALLEEIMSVAPVTVLGKIRAFHTIMMLLNFKTAIRNVLGNVILFVPETVADFADAAIDKTMSVVTGKRTKMRPFTYVANKLKGLPQPIRDFKAGMELARIEGESQRAQLQKGFDTMIMLARLTSQSKFELQDVKRMNARVFDSKAMRMLEDSLTLLLSPADRAFYVAAYRAELANQMQIAKTDVPSKEMIEYAQMIGMKAIYQNDNFVSKGLQKAREGLNWITAGNKEFGLGEMFFKFTRVPGSLLIRGLEYSPAGFIRALYQLMPPVFGKQFNQREFVTAFSRAAVGTGSAFTIGYMLEQLGVLTGAEAEDTDQRELEREMGFQRYSINASALKRVLLSGNFFTPKKPEVGDFLVSYDWAQPVAMPMAMGAIVSQKKRTGKGEDDAASFMASMVGAGAKTLEEQPLVSGIFQLFQKFTYAKQELEANNPYGTVKALLDSYADLPATFVPTAVNQVNQYLDNVSRNSTASDGFDKLIDRVAARTPHFGGKMTERRTTTGQPRLKIPSGNTFFNVFLNPAFTNTIKSNPIGDELMRLYRDSGEKQQFPRKTKRTLTVNGERKKLDAEQIARYQHATGKLTIYRFDHLMRMGHYVSRGDEDRAKILANEMTDIGTAVKVLMFDHRPKTMRKSARRMLMELQQSGVDLKQL